MPINDRVQSPRSPALDGHWSDAPFPAESLDGTALLATEILAAHGRDRSDAVHHEINRYVVTSIAGIASGNSPPLA